MAVKVEMLLKVITVSYLLVAIHGSLFSFFLKNLFPIRVWFSLVPNERRLIEIHSSGNMYTSSQLAIANRMKKAVGCTVMNDHEMYMIVNYQESSRAY